MPNQSRNKRGPQGGGARLQKRETPPRESPALEPPPNPLDMAGQEEGLLLDIPILRPIPVNVLICGAVGLVVALAVEFIIWFNRLPWRDYLEVLATLATILSVLGFSFFTLSSHAVKRRIRWFLGGVLTATIIMCVVNFFAVPLPPKDDLALSAPAEAITPSPQPTVTPQKSAPPSQPPSPEPSQDEVGLEHGIASPAETDFARDTFQPDTPAYKLLKPLTGAGLELNDFSKNLTGPAKTDVTSSIFHALKLKVATERQTDSSAINGHREFVRLVREANQIAETFSPSNLTLEQQTQVIALREQAYLIFPTKDLRILLGEDYRNVARLTLAVNDRDAAYAHYMKAIDYELAYLRILPSADTDEFYRHCYKIGIIYQCIADIVGIQKDYRWIALYFSTCFLEESARNIQDNRHGDAYYSCYYAAFANHKLCLEALKSSIASTEIYIRDAHQFYLDAQGFPDYQKQRKNLEQYQAQIVVFASRFQRHTGRDILAI